MATSVSIKFAKSFAGGFIFFTLCNSAAKRLGEFVICTGQSMLPTIHDGDVVVAERVSINSLGCSTLHRGDLISVISPFDHRALLCKRLLLKEGDFNPHHLLPSRRIPQGHATTPATRMTHDILAQCLPD